MSLNQEQQNIDAFAKQVAGDVKLLNSIGPLNVKSALITAKGDGATNDQPKLLQAFLAAGTNEIYLPAGTYVCSSAIALQNVGPFRIKGAGSNKTKILFNGTTGGLKIANMPETNIGLIEIDGVSIVCGSDFAAGTVGLYLMPHNYNNRGVRLNDVQVVSDGTHEWPVCIQIENACYTTITSVLVKGVNLNTGTIGIKLKSSKYNGVGWPSVNHTFMDVNALAVGTMFDVSSEGTPGVEGLNFNTIRGVAIGKGFNINTAYVAPWVSFSHTHVECFNNQALYISGAIQIQFDGTNLFYVHGSPANAVQLHNCINVSGDIGQIITFDQIPYAVELSGTGGAMDFRFRHTPDDGRSKDLKIGANLDNVFVTARRNWSGKTSNDRLDTVDDLSGRANLTGSGEKAKHTVYKSTYVSADTVIDGSTTDLVQCGNGSTAITLTVDRSKILPGQLLIFKRYDSSSSGSITIKTSDSNISLVQGADSAFVNSITLPTAVGQRQMSFMYDGSHLEFVGF